MVAPLFISPGCGKPGMLLQRVWGWLWVLAWVGLILHGGQAALGLSPLRPRMPPPWGMADPGVGECAVLAGGTALRCQLCCVCGDSKGGGAEPSGSGEGAPHGASLQHWRRAGDAAPCGGGWVAGGGGAAGAFAVLQGSTGGRGGVPLCEPGGWRMFGGWRKVYVLLMGLVGGTGSAEKCMGGVAPRRGSVWGHCASHLWGPWHCA